MLYALSELHCAIWKCLIVHQPLVVSGNWRNSSVNHERDAEFTRVDTPNAAIQIYTCFFTRMSMNLVFNGCVQFILAWLQTSCGVLNIISCSILIQVITSYAYFHYCCVLLLVSLFRCSIATKVVLNSLIIPSNEGFKHHQIFFNLFFLSLCGWWTNKTQVHLKKGLNDKIQ